MDKKKMRKVMVEAQRAPLLIVALGNSFRSNNVYVLLLGLVGGTFLCGWVYINMGKVLKEFEKS